MDDMARSKLTHVSSQNNAYLPIYFQETGGHAFFGGIFEHHFGYNSNLFKQSPFVKLYLFPSIINF